MKNPLKSMKIGTQLFLRSGVVFGLIGLVMIYMANYNMRQQALAEAESKAMIILDLYLATHTYFSQQLKPALFEQFSSSISKDYFEPVWMSSTFAVREINKYFQEINTINYYYKECAVNARSPQNEAEDYEKEFLDGLNAGTAPIRYSVLKHINDSHYFVTLRKGEAMEPACLRCHSTPKAAPGDLVKYYGPEKSFNRHLNEIIHAISIRIPLNAAFENANRFSLHLSTLLTAALAFLFTFKYWLNNRMIFRPLNRLRENIIQITEGKTCTGKKAPLPAGNELDDLQNAFEYMDAVLKAHETHLNILVREHAETNARLTREIKDREHAQKALDKKHAQLIHAGRLSSLGEMAAGVAHELNQPLSLIRLRAESHKFAMKKNRHLTPAYVKDMDMIIRAVDRAATIIEHMCAFSRTRSNYPSKTDAVQTVGDCMIFFGEQFKNHGISFHLDAADNLPKICVDPQKLEQIMINFLSNARYAVDKKTGKEKKISIQITHLKPEQQLLITIEDNGIGMTPEEKARCMEPFFTTKEIGEGTGLGMSIAHGIVKEFNGNLEIESRKAKGTIIRVRFPAPAPDPHADRASGDHK